MVENIKEIYEELKRLENEGKVIFGTDKALRLAKLGKVKRVVLAKNALDIVKEQFRYYGKIGEVEVIESDLDREELGQVMGKPFLVAVVAELK